MMLMIKTVQVIFSLYVVKFDLSVYKKVFETPFFEDMERFYTNYSAVFLDIPVTECVKKVNSESINCVSKSGHVKLVL